LPVSINIMNVVTGIDIVNIGRFKKVLETSGKPFLKRIFLENEYFHKQPEHLAGIFAAKEAVKKAFDITEEVWRQIEVGKSDSGKPGIILNLDLQLEIVSTDVSISHDGDYVIAIFIALIQSKNSK